MEAEKFVLGIDCGGTHTDAALLAVNETEGRASLAASAKTATRHDNLPLSVAEACHSLRNFPGAAEALARVERVTLGTTLEVNALTQDKADKVGLALSAGPGLDPGHFALGEHVCIVPGGLDHRGVEVSRLFTEELAVQAAKWPDQGVAALACVGKFSPRNPAHENMMGEVARKASGLPATLGHELSGRLNFPRRIATAYYNAAVARLHANFLDAVEAGLSALGIHAKCRLLKADGGAIPFAISRREPAQSILSGPAASVMGAMASWKGAEKGCSLLLDMGGTTTDIAMFHEGSPVVDRQGMLLRGRRTLVRSLASVSIGVGGDSSLNAIKKDGGTAVAVGPLREGPAMAFGGAKATFLDALNVLDGAADPEGRGDVAASLRGMAEFAGQAGLAPEDAARLAVKDAMSQINRAAYGLVANINSGPIYTLAALRAASEARPEKICLVGGPARVLAKRLAEALGLPVEVGPHPQVANAIGAALTKPTAGLEVWADTGKGELYAPACGHRENIPKNMDLEEVKEKAKALLAERLRKAGIEDADIEVTEADLFATLDDYGRGSRDMRVACQARPGIAGRLA